MGTRKYQIAAWVAFTAIVFVTVSPIEMRPGDIFSVDVDRALAFGALAAMFMIAYPRQALPVGIFMTLSAGGIELLQALSPTRHARLDDAIIKGIGALAGMAFALAYNDLRIRRHAWRDRSRRAAAAAPALSGAEGGMKAVPVTSDLIESVYFSAEDGRLRIRMRDGEERLFSGVGEGAVTALASAASADTYYMENIRKRYPRIAA